MEHITHEDPNRIEDALKTTEEAAAAPRELKMWLAVRTDLDLSIGKACTQAGHAYQEATIAAVAAGPERFEAYRAQSMPKISVRADGEAMLRRVAEEAGKAGLPHFLVTDEGRSEIPAGTVTMCAFGPAYRDELPGFLKRLRML